MADLAIYLPGWAFLALVFVGAVLLGKDEDEVVTRETQITLPEHAVDRDAPTLRPPAPPDERVVLERFRALSDADRKFILKVLELLVGGGR